MKSHWILHSAAHINNDIERFSETSNFLFSFFSNFSLFTDILNKVDFITINWWYG